RVLFRSGSTCSVRIMAGRAEKHDGVFIVPVELTGTATSGGSILYARAEILLVHKIPKGTGTPADLPISPYPPGKTAIYDQDRLFHGTDLQGIEQIDSCSAAGITAQVKAAPKPEIWIRQPLRTTWLTDPLVIDSAFQLMILWSFERSGCGSLPTFAGRYRQFQESFPREGSRIAIKITAERSHGATADIEFYDRTSGAVIARMENYECIIDTSLQAVFRRNQLAPSGTVELEVA
ncbi:MAG: polyketide synthase dehydratase domain-containing protein, partial [Desulfuromonadaceae bacterium]|nr:polyketide synthase dehydratase domain-containing protein [Desulfuromonadaceae bacterium]